MLPVTSVDPGLETGSGGYVPGDATQTEVDSSTVKTLRKPAVYQRIYGSPGAIAGAAQGAGFPSCVEAFPADPYGLWLQQAIAAGIVGTPANYVAPGATTNVTSGASTMTVPGPSHVAYIVCRQDFQTGSFQAYDSKALIWSGTVTGTSERGGDPIYIVVLPTMIRHNATTGIVQGGFDPTQPVKGLFVRTSSSPSNSWTVLLELSKRSFFKLSMEDWLPVASYLEQWKVDCVIPGDVSVMSAINDFALAHTRIRAYNDGRFIRPMAYTGGGLAPVTISSAELVSGPEIIPAPSRTPVNYFKTTGGYIRTVDESNATVQKVEEKPHDLPGTQDKAAAMHYLQIAHPKLDRVRVVLRVPHTLQHREIRPNQRIEYAGFVWRVSAISIASNGITLDLRTFGR